jgi:hypothetical protein
MLKHFAPALTILPEQQQAKTRPPANGLANGLNLSAAEQNLPRIFQNINRIFTHFTFNPLQ